MTIESSEAIGFQTEGTLSQPKNETSGTSKVVVTSKADWAFLPLELRQMIIAAHLEDLM